MPRTAIEEILELPATARVEIAQQIWESVAQHADAISLTPSQREELERRWQEMRSTPGSGEEWSELLAKLRAE